MKSLKISTLITSHFFWLGLILIASFWVRTYRIDRPIADWHSWRQADTASVSRNFVKDGFTIFAPKFDDLFPLSEKNLPNPEGYRYVEFPTYNILVGLIWTIYPYQEAMARLVSILISLGSIVLLFFLTKRFANGAVGLITAFIFAFLPYNIFYSTVILPEPLLVFFMIGTLLFFDLWVEKKRSIIKEILFGSLATLFFAFALLTKPTSGFLTLPLLYLSYYRLGPSFYKLTKIWLFAAFSVMPFIIWRLIALQHPEGIPRFKWLLNGNNIRFKGAFFYWIFHDRLSRLLIGGSGFALLILGLIDKFDRRQLFFLSWLFAMVVYVVVFATGNVTHDYYQVPLVPILAIFVAKGVFYLLTKIGNLFERTFYIFLALFLVGLMFGIRWREVKTLFNINNPVIVEAGKVADEILPKDARVIAPYNGDTAFLYQTNRKGWAALFVPLDEMIEVGATHYVTVNFDDQAKDIMAKYKIIKKTDYFAIIDLKQKVSE